MARFGRNSWRNRQSHPHDGGLAHVVTADMSSDSIEKPSPMLRYGSVDRLTECRYRWADKSRSFDGASFERTSGESNRRRLLYRSCVASHDRTSVRSDRRDWKLGGVWGLLGSGAYCASKSGPSFARIIAAQSTWGLRDGDLPWFRSYTTDG